MLSPPKEDEDIELSDRISFACLHLNDKSVIFIWVFNRYIILNDDDDDIFKHHGSLLHSSVVLVIL